MSLVQLLLREAPINATGPHGVMVFYPVGYALNSRRRVVPSCRLPQHRLALHTSVCNATVAKHCCFEEDQPWRGAACHKNANVKFGFVCVCACVRVRVSCQRQRPAVRPGTRVGSRVEVPLLTGKRRWPRLAEMSRRGRERGRRNRNVAAVAWRYFDCV